MKPVLNLGLSLLLLVACVYGVWPNDAQLAKIIKALDAIELRSFSPYLAASFVLMAVNHFFRAWRWNNLLAPIGVKLPPGRLMAVSSVGFMAILAFPARLGEFVRPALIRDGGKVSATAALGTVAVERIVDGLLVSLVVFIGFFAERGPNAPEWMMPIAYLALGSFTAALLFLGCTLKWSKQTIRFCVAATLLPKFSPRLAATLESKLSQLITGFLVLRDQKNLLLFLALSIAYWTANGLALWVLALGFGLDLDLLAAFTITGVIAVGITLPNTPALAGQFHFAAVLGLSVYFSKDYSHSVGLAFATILHLVQVVWYTGAGTVALATKYVSIAEIMTSRPIAHDESAAAPR